MELSQHLNIIKKHKVFIMIFALSVMLVSFLIAYFRPISYDAVVSFDVNLVNRPQTTDYQYGSYYDLKGAEMFTQNVMSWLRTASVIEEIYQEAEVGYKIKNITKFTNRFKTRQYGAQNFVASFNDLNYDNGEKIGLSMGKVLTKKVEQANKNINNQALFTLVAAEPIVIESKTNLYLVSILGLLAGLVISTLLVYLKYYFKNVQ